MKSKQFANTDITISAIGLGAMPLSLSTRPSQSQAIAVIHRAISLGVTFIDTADSYCQDEQDKHHNERLLAKALQEYPGDRSKVKIATKGGLMRPRGEWRRNGNPEHLQKAIQSSFKALGGKEPIFLWQYHAPDPDYSLQESLRPVKQAVDAGFIRFVGVSNFSCEQIQQAQEIVEIASVQNQYNPWQRQPELDGVLAYCEREKLTFFPYRPLRGRYQVGTLADEPILQEISAAHQASVYQVVLAWLMEKSPCIVPIPGASKLSSIEDSVRAVNVKLSPQDREKIDGLAPTK
ncbi:MAG: aldo/keto reductase [Chloroflexaceae bacterium]|nr:aldo/keto reductase [Chloroflexaceae bacterium]